MGDTLYGVTMEEAGVSKIVSVRMNNDDKDGSETSGQAETPAVEEDTVTA